jgi:hypothetical protein
VVDGRQNAADLLLEVVVVRQGRPLLRLVTEFWVDGLVGVFY